MSLESEVREALIYRLEEQVHDAESAILQAVGALASAKARVDQCRAFAAEGRSFWPETVAQREPAYGREIADAARDVARCLRSLREADAKLAYGKKLVANDHPR